MIPLVDLKAQYAAIRPEIDEAIARVIANTSFIMGAEVRDFEEAFADACGVKYAVGVASGTAALELALEALDVGASDEVITTPLTFLATAEAIAQRGARPVFVDIEPGTVNLDPSLLSDAVTPQTRVIMPVHLYGLPANMDAISKVARQHNLFVVEDAAQAHLARYRGRVVGGLGDVACFSFYPGKNLGAYGDGGMVVTNDETLADKVRLLRNHGRSEKYVHQILGHGERLDALQAAILAVKLPHLPDWNIRRRAVAARYRELLTDSPLTLLDDSEACEQVYHLFVVRTPQRDALQQHLKERGIAAGIHYPLPLHLQPACAYLGYGAGDFPQAEQAANEVLSLPIYPELTDDQIAQVVDAIKEFFEGVAVCTRANVSLWSSQPTTKSD
jgi:dTDP-4-amino-4,6-dideoxygalactose transaminase